MKLLLAFALVTLAAGHPGLLRVPKVYNAVVTTNQNLSPSRAFPVIQPVLHRTAIGYVPPFYYSQVVPHVLGPDVARIPQSAASPGNEADVQAEPSSAVETSKSVEPKGKEEPADQNAEEDQSAPKSGSKGKKEKQHPLSFYPNYQSLYYDPYFYSYNGISPYHLPGTYYVDYQPYGVLDPIPATTPKNALSGHLLSGYHEEKKEPAKVEKEKVPDVPPPPLPTAVPKSS